MTILRHQPDGGAAAPESAIEVNAHDRTPALVLHVQGLIDERHCRSTCGKLRMTFCHRGIQLGRAIVGASAGASVVHHDMQTP